MVRLVEVMSVKKAIRRANEQQEEVGESKERRWWRRLEEAGGEDNPSQGTDRSQKVWRGDLSERAKGIRQRPSRAQRNAAEKGVRICSSAGQAIVRPTNLRVLILWAVSLTLGRCSGNWTAQRPWLFFFFFFFFFLTG